MRKQFSPCPTANACYEEDTLEVANPHREIASCSDGMRPVIDVQLEEISPFDHVKGKLEGLWEGVSVPDSRSKQVTWWLTCFLSFSPPSTNASTLQTHFTYNTPALNSTKQRLMIVSGHGTSLWKDNVIQFTVSGMYDPETGHIEMHKQHIGKFTNVLVYHGKMSTETYGSSTATSIRANFHGGSLVLVKSDSSRPEKALATDTASRAGDREMQPESKEKDACMGPTAAATTTTTTTVSSASSVTYPSSSPCPEPSSSDFLSTSTTATTASVLQNGKAEFSSSPFHSDLSGTWVGISVARGSTDITLWKEVELCVDSETGLTSTNSFFSFTGQGISLWRGQRIPFGIQGKIHHSQLIGEITKTHTLQYSNSTSWNVHVDLFARVITGSSPECIMVMHQLLGSGNAQSHTVQAPPTTTPNRDQIPYGQTTKQASADVLNNALSDAESIHVRPVMQRPSSFEHYKFYLEAMLKSGPLTGRLEQALSAFREEYHISDLDHELAIEQLRLEGIQPENKATAVKQNDQHSDDICKICFDQQINCVILPCGHFAVCIKCSERLTNCPLCRTKIGQAKLIYRS